MFQRVTFVSILLFTLPCASARAQVATTQPAAPSAAAAAATNLRRTVTVEVAEKTKDAVVYISTTKVVNQRVSPFGGNDPFWNQFDFGYRKVPIGSLGSGFIIHKDRYVVTNHQVIGINTAIRGDAQNIGFAIQVNRLRDLIPDLMNPSQVTKVNVPVRLKEVRKLAAPSTVITSVVAEGAETRPIASIAGQEPRD